MDPIPETEKKGGGGGRRIVFQPRRVTLRG